MHAPLPAESPSKGCLAFAVAFDAVVDGAADARTVTWAESHAADCRGCAQRLASARAYRDRFRRLGETDGAPATLHARVRAILQEVRGSPTH